MASPVLPGAIALELLVKAGAIVSYTDPHVERLDHGGAVLTSVPFETALTRRYDCAVVANQTITMRASGARAAVSIVRLSTAPVPTCFLIRP